MMNKDKDRQEQEIRAMLRDHPVPPPADGFYDRALTRAMHEGHRRHRNRWVLTGFGSAVAAGLVLWFIGGFLLGTPPAVTPEAEIPGVTMTLEEPRTVNLVFASTTPLDGATLTVTLPEGIELAGFPGQREIAWTTSLTTGKNVLPLELIAVSATGGELLAELRHNDRNRTFRLRVNVG